MFRRYSNRDLMAAIHENTRHLLAIQEALKAVNPLPFPAKKKRQMSLEYRDRQRARWARVKKAMAEMDARDAARQKEMLNHVVVQKEG